MPLKGCGCVFLCPELDIAGQGETIEEARTNLREESDYLNRHRSYYDPAIGVFFYGGCCCCNLVPKAEIAGRYEKIFAAAGLTGAETFGGASHEQYTFPYYKNYIPDHLDRIAEAVRCLTRNGCKAVFFNECVLGNTAWEE